MWGHSLEPGSAAGAGQRNAAASGVARRGSLASLLLTGGTEHHVPRVPALWIVLTLAAGPNAALLCGTSCDQTSAGPSRCHTEAMTTAPIVSGDEGCAKGLSAAVFLGEDVRRGVNSHGAGQAVLVTPYQFAHSATDACPALEPGRQWSLDHRPLALALRI